MDLEEKTGTAMIFDLHFVLITKTNGIKNHFQDWFCFILQCDDWKPMSYNHYHPLHSSAIWVCTAIKLDLYYSLQSCVLVVTVKQSDTIHAEVLAKWSSQQIPMWGCWDSALVSMVNAELTNQQGLLGDACLH